MSDPIRNSIRELRSGAGVTQETLAGALMVSRQTIIAIEKGHYTPSLPLAIKIARFFKRRVEDIFTMKK